VIIGQRLQPGIALRVVYGDIMRKVDCGCVPQAPRAQTCARHRKRVGWCSAAPSHEGAPLSDDPCIESTTFLHDADGQVCPRFGDEMGNGSSVHLIMQHTLHEPSAAAPRRRHRVLALRRSLPATSPSAI
jgi:hypothetical protein